MAPELRPRALPAILVVASLASAPSAQDRIELRRPPSDPEQVATARRLLESRDPPTIARGALQARDESLHELVPELRALQRTLPRNRDIERDLDRWIVYPETLSCLAVLDALDRVGARLPAEELAPRLRDWFPRDLALMLLLRSPDAGPTLLQAMQDFGRDDLGGVKGTMHHLAIGNHLSAARHPSPEWVDRMLSMASTELGITIDGLSAKGGWAQTSCGSQFRPEFPALSVWTLTTREPPADRVRRLVAPGIRPVWALRHDVSPDGYLPGVRYRTHMEFQPSVWLTTLAGCTAEQVPDFARSRHHRWSGAEALAGEVAALRETAIQAWRPLLAGLRRRGLLSPDPLPRFEDPVVRIVDGRRDRTEPLPRLQHTRLGRAGTTDR